MPTKNSTWITRSYTGSPQVMVRRERWPSVHDTMGNVCAEKTAIQARQQLTLRTNVWATALPSRCRPARGDSASSATPQSMEPCDGSWRRMLIARGIRSKNAVNRNDTLSATADRVLLWIYEKAFHRTNKVSAISQTIIDGRRQINIGRISQA
ncbi:hypothetical protein B0H12DRAFT_1119192 [Mycena haematopus]|nr:hypothetical protein B0H12DRAFT_1119192 [Mycena haematopus]